MDPITLTALSLAAKYVPDIVGYFKGDAAANIATKVIDVAQAVTGTESPAAATTALAEDPEKARTFHLAIMDREAELQRMYLADTQSARMRDVELAKAGARNIRANVLVASAMLLVLLGLAIVVWTSTLDEYAKGFVTLIIGRALGWVDQVFSYEFGTTRTSQTKDTTIANLTK